MTADEIEYLASGLERCAQTIWRDPEIGLGSRVDKLAWAQRCATAARMLREPNPAPPSPTPATAAD
jgi:hypothetical protein